MHEKHPAFLEPDSNAMIWRYMDFPKFVSLLDKKALFFAKANILFDKFEGTLPEYNVKMREQMYEKRDKSASVPIEELTQPIRKQLERMKQSTLINGWHINEYESAAMWDLYSNRRMGIAIQSKYERLANSFEQNKVDVIWIGKVKYIDFKKVWINELHLYEAFIDKRTSFEHEHELRAVVCLPEGDLGNPNKDELYGIKRLPATSDGKIDSAQLTDRGKYIQTDLDTLIEQIYVSPLAEQWFTETVKSLVTKFGFNKEITKSELYDLH